VDSGYGSVAAEMGLLGLFSFAYLAVKVGVEGFRAWKALPLGRVKDLFIGPALMAVTYPTVSVIFQPQATLPSSIYFWLLIGMLVRAATLYEEGHANRVLRAEMHPGQ
jgi:O-antigen ligase